MKNYTESELEQNYTRFMQFIEDTFEGDRQEKLLYLYGTDEGCFGLRALTAPASSREHFHNAYDGGYIDHVMNVCRAVRGVRLLFEKLGGPVDFTDDEMMFSALNHDLGKLGNLKGEQYLPNDSEWHRKNQGLLYKMNEDIQWMTVTDRTLFLLQHFGIKYTEKEQLAIKLSDGMYDESNEQYLKANSKIRELKTTLPRIVHWADHIATTVEGCVAKEGLGF